MKFKNKIIELLAQYLKKTDQVLDRMDRTDRNVEVMSRALAEDSLKFNNISQEIRDLVEKQDAFLEKLMQLNKVQNTFLEELLQLSKVQNTFSEELIALRKDQIETTRSQGFIREDCDTMREQQGIMLKELISISKRVSAVEERH